MNRLCCRTRLLEKLPTKQHRMAWLAFWRTREGDACADAVKANLLRRYGGAR